MMDTEPFDLTKWKRKRKSSYISFCIGHFIYGVSVGIYFCTEFYYFKETQHVSNPAMLYGIAEGCFFAGGILFSLCGAVYYDHLNRVRNITLLTAFVCALGNILYLCYTSPIFVILGMFLIGTVVGWAVISVAEVVMLYEAEDLARRLGFLGAVSSVGTSIAPCTTFLFDLVHERLGWWQLTVNNMAGLVMGALYVVFFLVSLGTVHDSSLLYNVKRQGQAPAQQDTCKKLLEEPDQCTYEQSEMEDGYKNQHPSEAKENKNNQGYLRSLIEQCKNKFVLMVCIQQLVSDLTLMWSTMLILPYTEEHFKWKPSNIAICYLIGIALGSLPTTAINLKLGNRVHDIDRLIFGGMLRPVIVVLLAIMPHLSRVGSEVLLYTAVVGIYSVVYTTNVGGMTLVAKLVPPEVQGSAEAMRYECSMLGFLLAGFTFNFYITYPLASTVVLVVLNVAICILLVVHRANYLKLSA